MEQDMEKLHPHDEAEVRRIAFEHRVVMVLGLAFWCCWAAWAIFDQWAWGLVAPVVYLLAEDGHGSR